MKYLVINLTKYVQDLQEKKYKTLMILKFTRKIKRPRTVECLEPEWQWEGDLESIINK